MVHIFWIVSRMTVTVKCEKCDKIPGILIPINMSRWPDFHRVKMSNFLHFSVNRSRWGVPPFRSHLQTKYIPSHLPLVFNYRQDVLAGCPVGRWNAPRHIGWAIRPLAVKAAGLGEFHGTWCAARI